MDDNIFTVGTDLGAPRSGSEIKVLICYLLCSVGFPLSKSQMGEVFQSRGYVNYFEYTAALSELCESHHIEIVDSQRGDDYYAATSLGIATAQTLERSIPASVREKSVKAALDLLARLKREADNKVEIVPLISGFIVRCTVEDVELPLLTTEIYVGDRLQAQTIKENFLKDPEAIYKGTIALYIGEK